MKNTLFLLIVGALLLGTAHTTSAQRAEAESGASLQGRISGSVVDAETSDPIASATVGVWLSRDSTLVTGAVTQNDGGFRIEGLRGGAYYVKISFVGYTTQTVDGVTIGQGSQQVDLGTIDLAPATQMMDDVNVTAERASVQIEIDRTVYNTADNPVSVGGTATHVLETIPSVDVDVDGNISLRGSGNVAILINGRPAPVSSEFIASYLRQLPAGTIDRIEVIPNPSARYEPDGMGGILNIVLKEEADRGLGATVVAGVDTRGGYSATGTLTYGQGPLNLAASYGFRQDEDKSDGSSFRINRYADPLTYLDQDELEDESETSHMFNLSGDYRLGRRTTLDASAQVGTEVELEEERNSFLELDASEDPTSNYQRLVREESDDWSVDFRLGFRHDFAGTSGESRGRGNADAHTLIAEARFDASANVGDELYTERFGTTDVLREQQQAQTDRSREEGSFQIDYVRPLHGWLQGLRLEAGYKGDLERMYSDLFSETKESEDGTFEPDVGLINTFDFDQLIHAFYGQLAREWGALGVQVGLRLESAQTTFTLENTNEAFDNDYTSMFPSAFLTYELTENNLLKASYSRRINRPRTWSLNPFPSYDDPMNIRIGNPSLRPEYVDAFEVGYVRYTPWGSLTLTPFYRRTTDVIRRIQELRDDGVTVRTTRNFDTASSSGIEFITSFDDVRFANGLRGYVSVEGFRMITDGTNVNTDYQNNAFGWGGRLNASYDLGNMLGIGGLDLQGTLRYRAPMDTEQGRIGSRSWTDLALRQQFLGDRASLTVRVRDVFGTAGFGYIIDQPTLYHEFERSRGGQQIGFTFTYSFGQQDQQRDRRDDGPGGGGGDFEAEPMD